MAGTQDPKMPEVVVSTHCTGMDHSYHHQKNHHKKHHADTDLLHACIQEVAAGDWQH